MTFAIESQKGDGRVFHLHPRVGTVAQAQWLAAASFNGNGRRDADWGFSLFTFWAGRGYGMRLKNLFGKRRAIL